MGGGRKPRGTEGGRARDAEARLGFRAARLARPVGLAGRLPQEPARRAGHSGDHPVLEYREGVTSFRGAGLWPASPESITTGRAYYGATVQKSKSVVVMDCGRPLRAVPE